MKIHTQLVAVLLYCLLTQSLYSETTEISYIASKAAKYDFHSIYKGGRRIIVFNDIEELEVKNRKTDPRWRVPLSKGCYAHYYKIRLPLEKDPFVRKEEWITAPDHLTEVDFFIVPSIGEDHFIVAWIFYSPDLPDEVLNQFRDLPRNLEIEHREAFKDFNWTKNSNQAGDDNSE